MGVRAIRLAAVSCLAVIAMSSAQAAETGRDVPESVLPDGPAAISFDEILADPTNANRNLRYARKLVQEGNLVLAATALERILLLNPEQDRVRLYYAIVLYRIANYTEAEREFEVLQGAGELPENLQRQVDRYLEASRRQQRAFKGSFTLGAGAHYDSNRNSYPQADEFRVLDTLIDGTEEENADVGRLLTGTFDVTYDPGFQRLREFYAIATGLVDDQVEEDSLDLAAGILEVGASYDATVVEIVPHLRHEHLRLDGDLFARISEAGLRLQRRFRQVQGLDAYVEGRAAYEEFSNTETLRFNNEQNGQLYEIEAGAGYNIGDSMRVAASYIYGDKSADVGFHSYESHKFRASYTWVFPNRMFALASGSVEFLDFDEVDPFISPTTTRKDTDSRVRLTYGLPASLIATTFGTPREPEFLRDLVLSVSGEYFRSDSNITNFDYENWRASALVTKRFEF
jgi:tetratricopeptide (TPR) repeat protein